MAVFVVTRHRAALHWLLDKGCRPDVILQSLDPGMIRANDVVVGNLPVSLAAEVCRRGGRYFHLSLEVPRHSRGRELGIEELKRCRPRLIEYQVTEGDRQNRDPTLKI